MEATSLGSFASLRQEGVGSVGTVPPGGGLLFPSEGPPFSFPVRSLRSLPFVSTGPSPSPDRIRRRGEGIRIRGEDPVRKGRGGGPPSLGRPTRATPASGTGRGSLARAERETRAPFPSFRGRPEEILILRARPPRAWQVPAEGSAALGSKDSDDGVQRPGLERAGRERTASRAREEGRRSRRRK